MRDPCRGKMRHPSLEMANAAVAALVAKRDEPKRLRKRLTAYWCPTCRSYHIGHRRRAAMPKES